MNDEKLKQAKALKEKIENVNNKVCSLTEKSFLEGHALKDCTFEEIDFRNRGNHVEIRIGTNITNADCGRISDSGKDQINTLITVFRNGVATVYKNELKKLEQEYEAL